MKKICEVDKCTGCGMCVNICSEKAISMKEGFRGFVFPEINQSTCVNCKKCIKTCPANRDYAPNENIRDVYAAWSKNKKIRRKSTSGGVFTMLGQHIINEGGVVAGVAWNDCFYPQHILVDGVEELYKFQGSKYSQSITSLIYREVKEQLEKGKKVLFSGTPCQVAALKAYLNVTYDSLYTVDVVCHGVPSNRMLEDHYSRFAGKIVDVNLRAKKPYWDYSYVKIDCENGYRYQALTIDDDYFCLFNVGYTLRPSCHKCKYANTHRCADITLADFWGFTAHNFATRNYNRGTSLVLVNSEKGKLLFDAIQKNMFVEKANIQTALENNKCLSDSFSIDSEKLMQFWMDYDNGMTLAELNRKYCLPRIELPRHLLLKRLYRKWKWIIKR